MRGLAPQAFDIHHLGLRKDQLQIGDIVEGRPFDTRTTRQPARGHDSDIGRPSRIDRDTLVGREAEPAGGKTGTQRALCDRHGPQHRHKAKRAPAKTATANPLDRLQSMVTRRDQIARLKIANVLQAVTGQDAVTRKERRAPLGRLALTRQGHAGSLTILEADQSQRTIVSAKTAFKCIFKFKVGIGTRGR